MYDLSFGSQAASAKAQLEDALSLGRPVQPPPSFGAPGAPAAPLPAALAPRPPFGMPPQGAPQAPPFGGAPMGNRALAVGPQMPPPGGPLMARPQGLSPLGMGAMSMSRGPAFQVAPARQAPGQGPPVKLMAKGGLVRAAEGGAWTRKEGKNPEGGLNAKGRASLRAQGHDIKPPVSAKLAAKSPKAAARRKSFCARSAGQAKQFPEAAQDPDSRLNKARRKWECK